MKSRTKSKALLFTVEGCAGDEPTASRIRRAPPQTKAEHGLMKSASSVDCPSPSDLEARFPAQQQHNKTHASHTQTHCFQDASDSLAQRWQLPLCDRFGACDITLSPIRFIKRPHLSHQCHHHKTPRPPPENTTATTTSTTTTTQPTRSKRKRIQDDDFRSSDKDPDPQTCHLHTHSAPQPVDVTTCDTNQCRYLMTSMTTAG